jgi:hypothetical protein
MSTSMRDLISGEAELDDEEDDESFDDEAGEERPRKRTNIDDSSEEEEDDDDEEEARKVGAACLCANVTPLTHLHRSERALSSTKRKKKMETKAMSRTAPLVP